MIDISPQLQSKIFDSLLLHMKAERAGVRYPRAAPVRGKVPRGKFVAGKPIPEKGARESKSVRQKPAQESSPQWDNLAADLHRMGLNKTTADALVSWAASQAEQSRQSPVKIRVLHRLGLIGPPQLEQLIENCAFLTSLPATREQIGKMALRAFSENLEIQGLGSSH
jgi:hypothetical protein